MAKSFGGTTYNKAQRTYYRFSSLHSGGIVQYTMGDGAVKPLSLSVDPDTMLRLGGFADGENMNGEVLND